VLNGVCTVGGQESGWIDGPTFEEWTKNFINEANELRLKKGTKDDIMVLFLDGHNSRSSDTAMEMFSKNNIVVITFPAHCTHLIQPLDNGFFAAFKIWCKKNKNKYYNMTFKVNISQKELKDVSEKDMLRLKLNNYF